MSKINNHRPISYNYQPIGSYLIEAGLITENCLAKALEKQKVTKEKIGEILVRQGYIKQNTLDYFICKIIEPERLKQEIVNKKKAASSIITERVAQTLNLPTLELSPQKVVKWLLIIISCLVIASSLVQFGAFFLNQSSSASYSGRLFHLDKETNIPTLYSSLALTFCSILLAIISYMKKVINSKYASYWKILSFIFLYLAIDELCSIHEILNSLRPILNAGGAFYFTWVVPGSVFVVALLILFRQFIQSLPPKTKRLFIIAGTIYISGAIGMEMIGGIHSEAYGQDNPIYSLIITIEETLEMLGIVVFIYALLSYITAQLKVVNLQISFSPDKKSLVN